MKLVSGMRPDNDDFLVAKILQPSSADQSRRKCVRSGNDIDGTMSRDILRQFPRERFGQIITAASVESKIDDHVSPLALPNKHQALFGKLTDRHVFIVDATVHADIAGIVFRQIA